MRFKKIYLEITNNCNLNCDFCIKNKRAKKFMTEDEFDNILNKLNSHTKYLYFHVLGEPLLHPKINNFINKASERYNVNITTNGYLIDRIKNNTNVRQINISLHSYSDKYGIPLENYLNNIFESVDQLYKNKTYISYRFWIDNIHNEEILKLINKKYNTNITKQDLKNNRNVKIKENIFINTSETFIWPDLKNDYYSEQGTCYALIDHIGILVDGTVVPCCLDSKGDINLGNIFKDDMNKILSNERIMKMIQGFRNNYKCEKLCRKCNFIKKDI